MKKIKRYLGIMIAAFMVTLMSVPIIKVYAAGGKVSVSASASALKIGDTVTITATPKGPNGEQAQAKLSFTYSTEIFSFVSCDREIYGGGAGGVVNVTATKASITLKAVAPGSDTVTVTGMDGVIFANEEEFGELSSGSVSVTVKNEATGGGENLGGSDNPGGGEDKPVKSGDNSLKSLSISPGKLSPAFESSKTKYKATVNADVTRISVDAKPAHAKAAVESVTGNKDLKVGENTVRIVVKAENGTAATYTIIVTRKEAVTEQPGDNPQTPPEQPDKAPEITIDGVTYRINKELPGDEMPGKFVKTVTTYEEQEVEAYYFSYKDLVLLSLEPVKGIGNEAVYYFYDASEKQFFPYINIPAGRRDILILPLSYAAQEMPDGYEETSVEAGEVIISGCQPVQDADREKSDFYMVYGVDMDGNAGWYEYDAVDMSVQRYSSMSGAQAGGAAYEEAYAKLQDKYKEDISRARLIAAVLIFVLAVAIITIVNILLFAVKGKGGKKKDEDEEIDYIDLDNM